MREIKFRAWCSNNKEWERGEWLIRPDGSLIEMKLGRTVHISNESHLISQYTGIKDYNGKEIYEGDIIIDKQDGNYFEIDFDKDSLRYRATELYLRESFDLSDFVVANDDLQDVVDGLVIGNIYENIELLDN